MRRNKLLEYLDARGLLDGSPEEIAAAKREYRRSYDRAYKRRYRRSHTEVRFTTDARTIKLLEDVARPLGITPSTFAKEAAIARALGKRYASELRLGREVLQTVTLIHSEVRRLCRKQPSGFLGRRITYERLAGRIRAMEEALREVLNE